jgi:hypothetical protein
MNFMDPKKFDAKVAETYEQFKASSEGHKAL